MSGDPPSLCHKPPYLCNAFCPFIFVYDSLSMAEVTEIYSIVNVRIPYPMQVLMEERERIK